MSWVWTQTYSLNVSFQTDRGGLTRAGSVMFGDRHQ